VAIEKKWASIAPRLFTVDGSAFGVVTIASDAGFKVKQHVVISAIGLPDLQAQVKRVLCPGQLILGPLPENISPVMKRQGNELLSVRSDLSAYTVALGSFIYAAEQEKAKLKPDDITQATYEQEPTLAVRSILVDECGNFYTPDNPLPATFTGTVTIGSVEIKDEDGDILEINPDGSINVVVKNPCCGEGSEQQENIFAVYNEVLTVPPGILTTIVSYTVPVGVSRDLERVLFSGENIAKYQVLVNGLPVATNRTYFGGDLSGTITFGESDSRGLKLNSGDIVTLTVLHNRPNPADFEGTIELLQVPAAASSAAFKAIYGEALAVVSGPTVNVVTYTVLPSITATLQRIIVSGENTAKYEIFLNASKIATKRTYFGGNLNSIFEFSGDDGGGLYLASGDVITVKVNHVRPYAANFESTIEVIES
jgi:hypothetical protein